MQSSQMNSPIMISSPQIIFKFTSSYFINLSQSSRVTFQIASTRLHLIPGAKSACAKNYGDDFRLWVAVFRGRKKIVRHRPLQGPCVGDKLLGRHKNGHNESNLVALSSELTFKQAQSFQFELAVFDSS